MHSSVPFNVQTGKASLDLHPTGMKGNDLEKNEEITPSNLVNKYFLE